MDPPRKRQKLDVEVQQSGTISTTTDASSSNARLLSSLSSFSTNNGQPETALDELGTIKKHLTNKQRVLEFLERDNRIAFRTLLDHIVATGTALLTGPGGSSESMDEETDETTGRTQLLREAISVVANCCHLSVMACAEVNTRFEGISRVFVRFLERRDVSPLLTLHTAVLRLLGNLCELTETASPVARHGQLLEQVVLSLDVENLNGLESQKMEELALRILRLLAKRTRFAKYIIQSGGCFQIAKLIVRCHRTLGDALFRDRADILQLLYSLLRVYAADVGRQLAKCSECVDIFLQFLLKQREHTKEKEADQQRKLARHWTEFILRAIHTSYEMRSQLGRDTISAVLSGEKILSDIQCRLLCCFLLDVKGRCWMRESGALERILDNLQHPEADNKEKSVDWRLQQAIMTDLCSIQHDHESMTITINHPNFLPSAIEHINQFLDQNAEKCQIQQQKSEAMVPEEEEEDNERSQEDPLIGKSNSRKRPAPSEEQQTSLCKDFSNLPSSSSAFSPAASPPSTSTAACCWSPSMSPSASTPFYAYRSPSSSPPSAHSTQFQLDDYLSEADSLRAEMMSPSLNIEQMAPEELEILNDPSSIFEKSVAEKDEMMDESVGLTTTEFKKEGMGKTHGRQIVRVFLTLISHFSHHPDERRSLVLLEERLLTTLIRYVSEAPEMDNRLCRALRRLARHQLGLQKLLEIDFYLIVIKHLIRRECFMKRSAPSCARCELRRDFGRRLLADHALLADSPIGEHTLLRQRLDAACERPWARMRVLTAGMVLFQRAERRTRFHHNFHPLDTLLTGLGQLIKEAVNEDRLNEESEEGKLCCDLFAALASSIHIQHPQIVGDVPAGRKLEKKSAGEGEEQGKSLSTSIDERTKCVLEEAVDGGTAAGDGETITFSDHHGRPVVVVPKRALCTYNEYFMGMFGSEFMERLTARNQFVFDADGECCRAEDFIKFLHFSIGCGLQAECVQVTSAESCAALLKLADKYLCTRLLDHLLGSGIASRFVSGGTLRQFLPLVLSLPTIGGDGDSGLKNVCAVVLLRFSTCPQLLATLRHLAHCNTSGSLIDGLVELLRNFLLPFLDLDCHNVALSTIPDFRRCRWYHYDFHHYYTAY